MDVESLSPADRERMRRWLESSEEVVIGPHSLTASELRAVDVLTTLALTRHRFEGAWSANDGLLVIQLLDQDESTAWKFGRIGALGYGWSGDFGSSLSVTLSLRAAKPLHARSVIPKGDEFLDSMAAGPIRVALVRGKTVVRCDVVDFTVDDTIHKEFLGHAETVKNEEPRAYLHLGAHFWEVVNAQSNLHRHLSVSDKLSLGWFDRYRRTALEGRAALEVLPKGDFAAVCSRVELADRVRTLVDLIANSNGDARPVLDYLATQLSSNSTWHFLKELQVIPDEEEGDRPFTGVQALLHQFLESPEQTDMGRQWKWMNIDGGFSTMRVEPRDFPSHIDPREYWNRSSGFIRLGLGYAISGHDVFVSKDEIREGAVLLPTCDDPEDCLKQAEFLLAEANANKKGTIPPRATVELRIGPYDQVELTEVGVNVFVVLRRDDGLIEFGAVEPHNGYFSYDLPDPDADHQYDVDRATAAVKLLLAAIIRDFWIVEHRERVFSTRKPQRERAVGRPDVGRVRVVYLPRVEYAPTERPNVEACAESLHTIERRAHFVAAHLRKSNSTSVQQKRLAERYGIQLPEGYTFVKPHERGAKKRDVIYRSRSALQSLYRAVESASQDSSVDWFRFERDVQELMASLGFEVEHVAASKRGDQGVDIYATKGADLDAVQWVIQCKCWRDKVGPAVVRELVGTLARFSGGTRGMIVTTSGFTAGAVTAAEESNVRLMDGSEFAERLGEVGAEC